MALVNSNSILNYQFPLYNSTTHLGADSSISILEACLVANSNEMNHVPVQIPSISKVSVLAVYQNLSARMTRAYYLTSVPCSVLRNPSARRGLLDSA